MHIVSFTVSSTSKSFRRPFVIYSHINFQKGVLLFVSDKWYLTKYNNILKYRYIFGFLKSYLWFNDKIVLHRSKLMTIDMQFFKQYYFPKNEQT